jgi:hypothetical protein
MRALSILFGCVVLSLVFVSFSAADPGNGAVVIRDDGQALFWYWDWDGEHMLVLGGSAEDALEWFHCGTPPQGEILPYHDKYVVQPNGKVKFLERASAYVRVFAPATPDDFLTDPCTFLSAGPQVAEGIASWTHLDNNLPGVGAGRNVWGFNEGGSLYDLSGLCPGGIVHYQTVRRWRLDPVDADYPACWPDCVVTKVAKGPRLSCKAF